MAGWMSEVDFAAVMILSALMNRACVGMFAHCAAHGAGETLVAPGYTELLFDELDDVDPDELLDDEPPAPPEVATRNLIVVQGVKMMSSWSVPKVLAPLGLNTPTTRKPTF